MSKRQPYNRKNEPKERDRELREKKGHALNNKEITDACDRRLAESGITDHTSRPRGTRQQHPAMTIRHTVTIYRLSKTQLHHPVCMRSMIAADRAERVLRKLAEKK